MSMTPAELVERSRAELDRIEQAMMDAPETIEALRPARAEAHLALVDAELRAAAGERAEEPRPTPAHLWDEWRVIRILRRSEMSARQKSYVINRFGAKIYRSLRW
jgi:hypothetical protein